MVISDPRYIECSNLLRSHTSMMSDEYNIYLYVIMKTKCRPGYHHNGFVATHALGQMMYSCGDNREGTLFS